MVERRTFPITEWRSMPMEPPMSGGYSPFAGNDGKSHIFWFMREVNVDSEGLVKEVVAEREFVIVTGRRALDSESGIFVLFEVVRQAPVGQFKTSQWISTWTDRDLVRWGGVA